MLLSVHLKPLAFTLAVTLLSAGHSEAATSPSPEELLAAEQTPAGIDVTVRTGGCTKLSDFEVSSSPVKNGKASVEFRRLKPDDCKGNFPAGLRLPFGWSDLKLPAGTKLIVKNPVTGDPAVQQAPRKVRIKAKTVQKRCHRSKRRPRHCETVHRKHAARKGGLKHFVTHHHRQHRHHHRRIPCYWWF